MDGFDDLLAPSRHALEDNPFADPFAKQRRSPDPWATPFAATDSHAFGNTSEHFSSLGSYSSSNNEFGASSSEFKPLDSDPRDSPAHTADDDDDDEQPLGQLRSPGFRESIPASFSETATIRPTTAESSFLSPLDNASTGLERPVIGPSLGGDTLGGWQTETQTSWQSEHPVSTPTKVAQTDEDSDDDKPVMQTLKHHDQDDNASVSLFAQYHSSLLTCFRKDISSYKNHSK